GRHDHAARPRHARAGAHPARRRQAAAARPARAALVAARMSWQALEIESDALRGNPLGDPHVRTLHVWSPEGDGPFPSVYVIQGMTGMVDAWFNVAPFVPSYPDEVARLAPEAVVVLVDAFTAYGGSQFVDSPGTGRYHTYLCDEVVPFVDERFPTLADAAHRGIAGKSSGGYGAMITPLLRPDLFGALATHAGDALFECCYQPEFPATARALRDKYNGSCDRFWQSFREDRDAWTDRDDAIVMNTYAMDACYSANEDGTVDLPFDVDTGELRADVWERWLAWDPVRMAPEREEVLRGLRAIWIDAGRSDEYFLDLGATAFHRTLLDAGVDESRVHFELFS